MIAFPRHGPPFAVLPPVVVLYAVLTLGLVTIVVFRLPLLGTADRVWTLGRCFTAIFVAGLLTLTVRLGPAALELRDLRLWAAGDTRLWASPLLLPLEPTTAALGRASFDGYTVELPWTKLPSETTVRIHEQAQGKSAFAATEAALGLEPGDIPSLAPAAEARWWGTLLVWKAVLLDGGSPAAAFRFRLPDRRGFQLGRPVSDLRSRITLHVFWIGESDPGAAPATVVEIDARDGIRQPDVNRLLRSLTRTRGFGPSPQ